MTLLSIFTTISLGAILLILAGLFVFIAFFTSSWGVNWWTWLLAIGTGSMRGGFMLIIAIIAFALVLGYFLGYFA